MSDGVRVDKWLWAARFFKTRGIARQAVDGGKVRLNGNRVKPARSLVPGDVLMITRGQERYELEILDLSERRGPAPVAQALYRETDASRADRDAQKEQRRIERLAAPQMTDRRPGKRDRRQIRQFKEGDG